MAWPLLHSYQFCLPFLPASCQPCCQHDLRCPCPLQLISQAPELASVAPLAARLAWSHCMRPAGVCNQAADEGAGAEPAAGRHCPSSPDCWHPSHSEWRTRGLQKIQLFWHGGLAARPSGTWPCPDKLPCFMCALVHRSMSRVTLWHAASA